MSACATLTSNVIVQLANSSAGAREIVALLETIHNDSRIFISEDEIIRSLRNYTAEIVASLHAKFATIRAPNKHRTRAISEVVSAFRATRQQVTNATAGATQILADLRSVEILWLAIASETLESLIPDPGAAGATALHVTLRSGIYTLRCFAALHTGLLKDNLHILGEGGPGITWMSAFDLGKAFPIHTILLHPRSGHSLLEEEIAQLREATYQRSKSG